VFFISFIVILALFIFGVVKGGDIADHFDATDKHLRLAIRVLAGILTAMTGTVLCMLLMRYTIIAILLSALIAGCIFVIFKRTKK
jgi:hypothetical protein